MNKIKKVRRNKTQEIIKQKMWDILWINNLESSNLIDSIRMIQEKGLEKHLVYEISMSGDEFIELLENDKETANQIQTIYESVFIEEEKALEEDLMRFKK
jgi:hypothetical protein